MTPMCTNQHAIPKWNLTYSSLALSLPISNLAHPYLQAMCSNTGHSTHSQPLRAPKHSQMLQLISCYYSLPFLSTQNRGLTRDKCEMIMTIILLHWTNSQGIYTAPCDFYPGPIVCLGHYTPINTYRYIAGLRGETMHHADRAL